MSSLQSVTEGAASVEERVESLRELRETLMPRKSSFLETHQLTDIDEMQETQTSDTALLPERCNNANFQREHSSYAFKAKSVLAII